MKELGLTIIALHTCREEWAAHFVDHWIIVPEGASHTDIIRDVHTFIKLYPNARPEGALTFWEEEVPLVAKLSAAFGWKGNDPEVGMRARDKFNMQTAFALFDCNAIRQHLLSSEDDLERAMTMIGFPAIIKPRYGTDSLFVVFCTTPTEARTAYAYIRKQYRGPYELIQRYDNTEFVYQEYIAGREFSVEAYCQNGQPHAIAIHQKTNMQLPFFMETGEISPPMISNDEKEILCAEAEKCLVALGVRDSLAHVEIKLSPRGPQVIEIGARMGGDNIFSSTKESYGFDLVRAGCALTLGMKVNDAVYAVPRYSMNFYIIPAESGYILSMEGFEILDKHPSIIDFHIAKHAGDTVLVPPYGFESIGWVLVNGTSHEDIAATVKQITTCLKVKIQSQNKILPANVLSPEEQLITS